MKRILQLTVAALALAAVPAFSAPNESIEGQTGSTLLGCLQGNDSGDFLLTDGTVDGAMLIGDAARLAKHEGHWVKLDGEAFHAGGLVHFRVNTITHMADSCEDGLEAMLNRKATAELRNAEGETVGQARFRQTPNGVLVQVDFEGLPPGMHALHIHETGACEAPDFKSAGGHFNPAGGSHGFLRGDSRHAGDMPNFEVPASGEIRVEELNARVSLSPDRPNSIAGDEPRALVVHAGRDDYNSQPSGAAGKRIACGVIELEQP